MLKLASRTMAAAAVSFLLGACGDASIAGNHPVPTAEPHPGSVDGPCAVDQDLLAFILPPDAIPALTLPTMVSADHPQADYLDDDSRVLGIVVQGEARAYPHNILWWHEIINDRVGFEWLSITYCPLTGSGLVFDPRVDGIRLDLGVSGLLFANNLVLFDRTSGGVYGPQLSVEGKCGGFQGHSLSLRGAQEMSWSRWVQLHPNTTVVADATGHDLPYNVYPYGDYDELGNDDLLVPMEVDSTRPMKERVLAVRGEDGSGWGYPFGELRHLGDHGVVNESLGEPYAVFYDALDGESAIAHVSTMDGSRLFFEAAPNRMFRDTATGSLWTLSGRAVSGPFAGRQLDPLADAYVLFWFAWRYFEPDGLVFSGG